MKSAGSRAKRLKKLATKWTLTIVSLVVALLPFWIFLAVKHFFTPEGFWQNLALAGLGLWIGGGIQILLLLIFLFVLYLIWNWDKL